MPSFYFRLSPTESVHWHFDRHPDIGELIPLSEIYGLCRVTAQVPGASPDVDAEYEVEHVRYLTAAELSALAEDEAAFRLPPRGSNPYSA